MNIFDFRINVVSSGGHVGELEGMAFIDGNKAVFSESEYGCQLTFELGTDTIEVIENAGCNVWHGMNVSFEGRYRKED
ncbi:hypothetical protein ABN702_22500 [Bacillus haimaensis]|uniref:hypothetical protein n=1 Tax=Bacillus haimaensis TaxID=3160967 RepID=UPI003AA8E10C